MKNESTSQVRCNNEMRCRWDADEPRQRHKAILYFTFSEHLLGVCPDTWVWVLQLLLKPGKSGAKGFRVLQEHFVHDQDCFLSNVGLSVRHLQWGQQFIRQCGKTPQSCWDKTDSERQNGPLKNRKTFSVAHQRHDVIGQVSSQIRSYKTREASEGDACVIHVGTAKILWIKKKEREKRVNKVSRHCLKERKKTHWPSGSDWLSAWWHQCSHESTVKPPGSQSSVQRLKKLNHTLLVS